MLLLRKLLAWVCWASLVDQAAAEVPWPELPDQNAAVEIPAQEWPQRPGPRTVRVKVHFPGKSRANVTADTGVMLTLHNWGGEDCVGTADPQTLADRLNVVALCVNYLQSGKRDSIDGPEPYDFGYLQALDALRALWFVIDGLDEHQIPFARGRIFATGGSGGGNVTLMANKLAPRTFAAVIDMCGMKKLSHDIAFGLTGGSDLNARWSRDPRHPNFLSVDEQELRFVGHPEHLALMKSWHSTAKTLIVHGVDDTTCPYPDAVELVQNLSDAGLDVEPHFVTKELLDGQTFASTGHSLGNRTRIALQVGGDRLLPQGVESLRRDRPSDFDARDELVRYPTTNGVFVISYKTGYPVGRFELDAPPPEYPDQQDLLSVRNGDGETHIAATPAEWERRRRHIRKHLERVMGPLPGVLSRVPLQTEVLSEERVGSLIRKKLRFRSDPFDQVTAWLLLPMIPAQQRRPAMLCLHQTTSLGKDEPAGLGGSPNLHYARELAERGYVTLAPDYPSLGEHKYDFAANPEYVSGSMKSIWDGIRSVDVLESIPEVDSARIGVIGHSLGGHGALFTAIFEPRLKVIVSSCGFSTLRKDDVPSWSGPRYMPRIATDFGNDAARLPFDFPGLIASLAPRSLFVSAPVQDDDFDHTGVQDAIRLAEPIFEMHQSAANLRAIYPDSPHDFPPAARQQAYEFIDQRLSHHP